MILSPHGRNHRTLIEPAPDFAPPRGSENFPLLGFRDIYATTGVIGLRIGERAKALAGLPVRVRGFMSPPLLAAADFFVLTRSPVHTCPFCDPGSAWPDDMVLALLEAETRFVDPGQPIEVSGELEIGAKPDPHTGTVRLVRLNEARWHRLGG
jgi:hypothetical protein